MDIIRQCDLAIFPTTYIGESFPLFLVECFVAAVPVVATDVGSIREMLTTDDGRVAGAVVPASADRERLAADVAREAAALVADPRALAAARSTRRQPCRRLQCRPHAGDDLEVFAIRPRD